MFCFLNTFPTSITITCYFERANGRGECLTFLIDGASQLLLGPDLQILHEAQAVRPHEFDEADKKYPVGSRNEHEIEELSRGPKNRSIDVRRQEFGLE